MSAAAAAAGVAANMVGCGLNDSPEDSHEVVVYFFIIFRSPPFTSRKQRPTSLLKF